MKIMVLDNYDSFTYNLVHLIKEIVAGEVDVYRNDQVELKKFGEYDKIVISPGPGVPGQAGITKEMISEFAATKSILGVCLGCQAIAEVFGGSLINLEKVYHGVATPVNVMNQNEKLFLGVPRKFDGGRYHSWIINEKDLPVDLEITAMDDEGLIMAIAHKSYDLRGVQFHPESILTQHGKQILTNWLEE
jgi:anthranilate synthase component II